jgi:hypothetical protein
MARGSHGWPRGGHRRRAPMGRQCDKIFDRRVRRSNTARPQGSRPASAKLSGHGSSGDPHPPLQRAAVGDLDRVPARPTKSRDVEGDNIPAVHKSQTAAPVRRTSFATRDGRTRSADFSWTAHLRKQHSAAEPSPLANADHQCAAIAPAASRSRNPTLTCPKWTRPSVRMST